MTQETSLQPQKSNPPLNIDMRNGIKFQNYSEAMQLAALMHNSGLAPKSLDTIPKVAIAMLMAHEVGLPIVTGIQNIAVINGKAGIWGDATVSLVRSSGLLEEGYPVEWADGEPFTDGWTFYCKLKRKGGHEVTGSFSWAEAKRAGFAHPKTRDGKDDTYSPWHRFPRRMMQWKARQWVYRDEFGDVLKGVRMAEELHDYIEMEPNLSDGKADSSPAWEPAPPPAEGFDFATYRQGLIDRGIASDEMFDRFIAALALHYKKPVEEVQEQVAGDPDGFEQSLVKWVAKNAPSTSKQASDQRSTPPHTTYTPPTTTDDPGPASAIQGQSAEPRDERREEYINLRSAGFSTFVHKHWNRIHSDQFSDEHRAEIKEKWSKLYPDQPWPVKDGQTGQEPVKPAKNGNGKVWCSRQGQFKPLAVCEQKCSYRGTCEDYAKHAAGAAPKEAEPKMISCPDENGMEVPVTMCDTCKAREGCPAWDDGVQ